MAEAVKKYQSCDGRLFDTEKEADLASARFKAHGLAYLGVLKEHVSLDRVATCIDILNEIAALVNKHKEDKNG